MNREELIVELLRLRGSGGFHATPEGVRGDTGAVPLQTHTAGCRVRVGNGRVYCTCWLRSLEELGRCLRLMRSTHETRPLWYAVHERYVAATRKPALVQVRRFRPVVAGNVEVIGLVNKTDLNRRGDGVTRVLVETWRPGLDPARVRGGVVWLAGEFRGSPEIPVELLSAAA